MESVRVKIELRDIEFPQLGSWWIPMDDFRELRFKSLSYGESICSITRHIRYPIREGERRLATNQTGLRLLFLCSYKTQALRRAVVL
jgi:hypothetical protein